MQTADFYLGGYTNLPENSLEDLECAEVSDGLSVLSYVNVYVLEQNPCLTHMKGNSVIS